MAQRFSRRLSLLSSRSGSKSPESRSRNGSQPQPRRRRRSRRTQQQQQSQTPKGRKTGNFLGFWKKSHKQNSRSSRESIEPLVSQLRQRQQTPPPRQNRPGLKPPQRGKPRPVRSSASLPLKTPPQLRRTSENSSLSSPASAPPSQRVVKRPKRRLSPMIYGARLLILGVGIGVISGTILSVLSALGRLSVTPSAATNLALESQVDSQKNPGGIETLPLSVQLHQEVKSLKQDIRALTQDKPGLNPGILLVDLDNGAYVDLNSKSDFPSASTIKVPILVAFFQAVDQGTIRLDETLKMENQHIAGGSGDMQYQPAGTEYSALQTATKMIVISDNTATNMLIERLGGVEVLNQKFVDWGLKNTVIRNLLPDLEGTNRTTPRDLVNLLTQLNQGGLVSMKSRDRIFRIMQQTENDILLPSGLGRGALIAHKTGNLKSVLADVGMIDMPKGKRYLLAVLVEHTGDESDAESLIRSISRMVYEYFENPPETRKKQSREVDNSREETENEED